MRTAWLLIVMPRSRSMSIRSRYCARALRSSTTPVSCSIRSASVDLPWSMCAMMQKFRMIEGSVLPGWGAEGVLLDTNFFRWSVRTAEPPLFHASKGPPGHAGQIRRRRAQEAYRIGPHEPHLDQLVRPRRRTPSREDRPPSGVDAPATDPPVDGRAAAGLACRLRGVRRRRVHPRLRLRAHVR